VSTTTTTAIPSCTLTVENTLLPLRAGLLPRIRRIVITGNDQATWDRTSAVSIEDIRLVIPLRKQTNRINALILIPSTIAGRFTPGVKDVNVTTGADVCTGTVPIE
jgi:hypothetical protein